MQIKDYPHFYRDLPTSEIPISQLIGDNSQFRTVPEDWHVVITDIKNSTGAVAAGLHQVVNLLATGSIIAALNIAQRHDVAIPFFFGGDGATLLVPAQLLAPCIAALNEHRSNALRNFSLDLRVGHIPMQEIYRNGEDLQIAKVKITTYLNIPIILGDGLRYAERIIKGIEPPPVASLSQDDSALDLTGMECRWDRIKPPPTRVEVVSLLIDALIKGEQASTFSKVLDRIEDIYGPIQSRNPISFERLRIKATLGKINTEMRAKLGVFNLTYLLKNWIFTLIGKLYYGREKSSQIYLENLVSLSDTLVIDGRINTVISGSTQQREDLVRELSVMEEQGDIIFGWYGSPESVMSCYVRNRVDQHIHFVDGSEGGYTQAAKMLKRKILG